MLAPIARDRDVRAVLSFLLRPRVAFGLWAANLALWHIPSLYTLALRTRGCTTSSTPAGCSAGLLVWTLLVDPGSHRRLSVGGRVALAAAMFAAGQILTDVLVFSFTPLYPVYRGAYGLSAVTDQQLAGIVMMVEQLLTLGTFVSLLLRRGCAAHGSPVARVSATDFSFEPVFLGLAVAAAARLLWRGAHRPAGDMARRVFGSASSSSRPR